MIEYWLSWSLFSARYHFLSRACDPILQLAALALFAAPVAVAGYALNYDLRCYPVLW